MAEDKLEQETPEEDPLLDSKLLGQDFLKAVIRRTCEWIRQKGMKKKK